MCALPLGAAPGARCEVCPSGHSFDVARQGYVNLLVAGQRRSRQPGDSPEMVRARRRFLGAGHYDPLSAAVSAVVAATAAGVVLDVGCGEGHHTRALQAPAVLGVDVAKAAVAAAAGAHPAGRYAVASAASVPLADSVVDAAVVVFGPVVAEELARVVRPGGAVVAAHPGPGHLAELRALVYADARPHEVKDPLRHGGAWFRHVETSAVTFPVVAADREALEDLFVMTPYRWHAPPDMAARLSQATTRPFETVADVRITRWVRLGA